MNLGPFIIDKPKSVLADRDLNKHEVDRFFNGTGLFTIPYLRATSMWVSNRAKQSGESEWPDVQIFMTSNGISKSIVDDYARTYNMRQDILQQYFGPVIGQDAFSFLMDVGRPRSRGVIKLKSDNYLDEPLINPGTFEDGNQEDIRVLVEAIQRAVYLVKSAPSYKKIGARLSPIVFPPCKAFRFRSDAYWECFVRHFTLTIRHYVGTAAMGEKGKAVVDPELRVNGVHKLRICDASIMPRIVSTNPNAPTIMIGEKLAHFIISEYVKNGRLERSDGENSRNDHLDDDIIRFNFYSSESKN